MDSSGSGKVAVAYQYPCKNALLAKPEVFFFIWNGLLDGGFTVIIAQKLNIKLTFSLITNFMHLFIKNYHHSHLKLHTLKMSVMHT
jgi:hypothetical protein